jgi:hypothetical protein
MQWIRALLPMALIAIASLLVSCGGGTVDCGGLPLIVNPQSGSADHAALPPSNQVQFGASWKVPSGCAVAAVVLQPNWTTSDSVNTTIGSQTAANGLATCTNATAQPAKITATVGTCDLRLGILRMAF